MSPDAYFWSQLDARLIQCRMAIREGTDRRPLMESDQLGTTDSATEEINRFTESAT